MRSLAPSILGISIDNHFGSATRAVSASLLDEDVPAPQTQAVYLAVTLSMRRRTELERSRKALPQTME